MIPIPITYRRPGCWVMQEATATTMEALPAGGEGSTGITKKGVPAAASARKRAVDGTKGEDTAEGALLRKQAAVLKRYCCFIVDMESDVLAKAARLVAMTDIAAVDELFRHVTEVRRQKITLRAGDTRGPESLMRQHDFSIVISNAVLGGSRGTRELVHYCAYLIIYEMSELYHSGSTVMTRTRWETLNRREFIYLREYLEWEHTCLKIRDVMDELVRSGWPQECRSPYSSNFDMHLILQQLSGHTDFYGGVWDRMHEGAKAPPEFWTLPQPASAAQKKKLAAIWGYRFQVEEGKEESNVMAAREQIERFTVWLEVGLTKRSHETWGLESPVDLERFEENAKFLLSDLSEIEERHNKYFTRV